MSLGKQIASLYAKIGFVIDSQEFQRIREALNETREQMQEIVEKTAEFAKQLSDISLSAGISPKAMQGLRLFAMEAGVAEDSIDSLAERSRNFARNAYFGDGNTYARWGLLFERFETSSSAFGKILANIGRFSEDSNEVRQLIEELNVDYQTLIRLSEQFQKRKGISSEFDYLKIDDEDVEKMREVRILQESVPKSWDLFFYKLYARQSENIYWYENKFKEISQWLQKSILDIFDTKLVDKFFGKVVKYMPVVVAGINNIEHIYDGVARVVTTLKKTGAVGLSLFVAGGWTATVTKLMKAMGYMDYDLATTLQRGLNNLIKSTGTFGIRLNEMIFQGVDLFEEVLKDVLPDALLNTNTFKGFFETAKDPNGGIILAISDIADKIINKIVSWIERLWHSFTQFLSALLDKAMYNISVMFLEMYNRIAKEAWFLGELSDKEMEDEKKRLGIKYNQLTETEEEKKTRQDAMAQLRRSQEVSKGMGYRSLYDKRIGGWSEYQAIQQQNLNSLNNPTTSGEYTQRNVNFESKDTYVYNNNGADSTDAHEDFFNKAQQNGINDYKEVSKYISDTELSAMISVDAGGF